MKRTFGTVLVVLGLLSIVHSGLTARSAPNFSYLMGMFVTGLILLTLGLMLRSRKGPQTEGDPSAGAERPAEERWEKEWDALKTKSTLAMAFGIVLMLTGSWIARQASGQFPAGLVTWLGGCALVVWGCVDYARWKGYSGWFGLFSYLLLVGLVVLLCLPNRRQRPRPGHQAQPVAGRAAVLDEGPGSGRRFLLTLVPLGVLSVILGGLLLRPASNVGAAEWTHVAPPGAGIQVLMPGTPILDQQAQETPAGKIEVHKFTARPKGKNEMFLVVSTQLPAGVGAQLGGVEGLLELGRKDILTASQGKIRSEARIYLDGHPGLELEAVHEDGGVVRARIYATESRLYEVAVFVSELRLTSQDVQKFFDSFRLVEEPTASPGQGAV